jgi:predicted nucleic acid-binding protein
VARVLVDANIFLELELGQARSKECKRFLTKVAKGRIRAATTDFILDSVAVVMEERGSAPRDIGKFFSTFLFYKGLTVHALGLKGRMAAADLMYSEELGFDDATSVAAMRRMGIREIVSFDYDFDGINGIERVEPNKLLART